MKTVQPIVSLCKRRGFIYPGSQIYQGFANTYSFGPYGVELKRNIKNFFWQTFVTKRKDIVGMDGPIFLHPKTWKASGHIDSFNDAMIDCKDCKNRYRADSLIEQYLHIPAESFSLKKMTQLIQEKIPCPNCHAKNFTEAKYFNLMFATQMSKTNKENSIAFLRPETAQAIFLEYKNILDTTRQKIPFGIAQIGKAFRNEITPGNFIFRVIEFEQMEIEYFIEEKDWQKTFNTWLEDMQTFCKNLGIKKEHLHIHEHSPKELSHYSKKTVDITYDFPFGRSELYGLAYRTDFDLKNHQKYSNKNLEYFDPIKNKRYLPHVIEPTFGVERTVLAILCDSFEEEVLENNEKRTVLHINPKIAPVKAAIFPLMKKEPLIKKAKKIYEILHSWNIEYDDSGAIGRRYRRQDELGTPYCITVDYDSLKDDTVTIRNRDTMKQERAPISSLEKILQKFLET